MTLCPPHQEAADALGPRLSEIGADLRTPDGFVRVYAALRVVGAERVWLLQGAEQARRFLDAYDLL